ncbi:MAG TPA: nitronate monooxygenase [Bacillus bacterium]|uniref:Probable nitronate monooxygenase n=1 Tax=Siminovitchia fordii TaxID=254759 RepID=A0ABQ4K863_9BACI|nr:nitronate monooxygenase [Siminovitchia fordii]GIN21895.1 2-nitropropane dioxygenase [Siminovitchia fordii]HBZ11776.1 nitronate monooxygenase [Bacillus sp. (in: firmicutes)]
MDQNALQALKENVSMPVIMAPMFLVSSPQMVINGCKAGVIGSFPLLNARTADMLDQWMEEIKRDLKAAKEQNPRQPVAPWAVNFIVHDTNKRYKEDLALIKKHQPPIVITSLGDPSPVVKIVHEYGGLVFSDVISTYHAKKAAEKGVDGLVLVCAGAGGHAGTINPFAFMGAVKEFWNGITILSGGISNGGDVLAVQAMGADFAYMGTRFITAEESSASKDYKNMVIDSTLDDLIYTDAFSGVKANYLKPSIRNAGLNPDTLESNAKADFSSMNSTGSKAWKDIWSAGQGVDTIHKMQPVEEIISELKKSYDQAKKDLLKESITT